MFFYPKGRQQRAISKLADKPIDAVWKLLSLTCLSWKDPDHEIEVVPKGGLKTSFWGDVDLEVLEWLEVAFQEAQPGVDSTIDVECPFCGHEFKTAVRALDFLFQRPKKAGSKS